MFPRIPFPLPVVGALLLTGFAPVRAESPLPASGWTIELKASGWKLSGFEGNEDLSGIAALDETHVLVGSDELIAAQSGTMDRAASLITAGALVPLVSNPSGKKMEVDIEGVAASPADHCYYVTGSHGVGKKKGDFDPTRTTVFRIPCDPADGTVLQDKIQQASLLPWLEQNNILKDHLKQPLQLNGLNIEGLAFHEGKLYFGLRGPNLLGTAYVVETTPDSLFGGGTLAATLHPLKVGPGRGIRELAAVRDGFIIVTGNASAEATKKFPTSQVRMADRVFEVWLWRPGQKPELSTIGVLPRPAGKAEALLVLEDTAEHVDLLVLFDGAAEGGATKYRLTRP